MNRQPDALLYTFPAETPHFGIPLGNGNLGALIWGTGNTYHCTINRQDYWSHRGEILWGESASYEKAKECVRTYSRETRYVPELISFREEGMPRPMRMPMGRFDLVGKTPVCESTLDIARGVALLGGIIPAFITHGDNLLYVCNPHFRVLPTPPSSEDVRKHRKTYGMPEPVVFTEGAYSGFTQEDGKDPVMCAMALARRDAVIITASYGATAEKAKEAARAVLDAAPVWDDALAKTEAFYRAWWEKTPAVSLSHKSHQVLYDHGMYRLAGATRSGTPAPTLQGVWLEDDRMAMWQCDYHFNVNVQMAHWPMLPGNHTEQFEPLAAMFKRWFPVMREYAKAFVGVDDGIMLPHGADDRGRPADTNWRCQFDAGSGGWMAYDLWELYRYGGDKDILRDVTYPMLRGALRVYENMLEEKDGQTLFYAPSPEYTPGDGNPWGANPSFHLAIIHALITAALRAKDILGIDEPLTPVWEKMRRTLPKATLAEEKFIALWQGQNLEESHRHHSHLAGIFPFDVFDIDGKDSAMLNDTMWYWSKMGAGGFVGWCMPWATVIHARMGNKDAAYYILDQYDRFFTTTNYLSSHNSFIRGFSLFHSDTPPYIMQLDAMLGAPRAILEMLAHERGGKVHLAPAVPKEWGDLSFEGILLPGGRYASGVRKDGEFIALDVTDATFAI